MAFKKGHPTYKGCEKGWFKKGQSSCFKDKKRPNISKEKHWNWKGGKILDSAGYIFILKPNHPFCNNMGYVRESHLVMENILGRYLKPEERVHHINGIKTDNRPKNLKLFANSSKHAYYHFPKGSHFGIHSYV